MPTVDRPLPNLDVNLSESVEAKFENCRQLKELPARKNERILIDDDATLKSNTDMTFRELLKWDPTESREPNLTKPRKLSALLIEAKSTTLKFDPAFKQALIDIDEPNCITFKKLHAEPIRVNALTDTLDDSKA
jgi:hypothetical protein